MNSTPKNEIAQRLERIFQELRNLKKEYPQSFEYIAQCSIYTKKDVFNVDAVHMLDRQNLIFYRNQINRLMVMDNEEKRFEMVKWVGSARVICIDDTLPEGIDPKSITGYNWIRRTEIYVCTGYKLNKETFSIVLTLKELGTGIDIVPPHNLQGFDSRRFVIDDYTKLN